MPLLEEVLSAKVQEVEALELHFSAKVLLARELERARARARLSRMRAV
jgi:hypothetical protein